ncbi:uncharacterized protein IL334_006237 [Kwoniella shivajii]|uniref:Transcription initiation factor TFIID subunit 10 n=1 Tax=Kwoniella shivajii TaxID=564305 RepID=A0ABZ1D617_9TREE|nr:hypothetical protein IL334_006237 [Kwoniella shivajii]
MSDQIMPGSSPAQTPVPASTVESAPATAQESTTNDTAVMTPADNESSNNAEAGPSTISPKPIPAHTQDHAETEDVIMANGDNDTRSTEQANGDATSIIEEKKERDNQAQENENANGEREEKDNVDGNEEKEKTKEDEEDDGPDISQLFAARREEELARRDRSLVEFLNLLDGYKPLIPEEITEYYLQRSGFECSDPRLKRLLSLSAQKFISDLSRDAYHFAKLRINGAAAGRGRPNPSVDRNRVVLTMEDLSLALGDHGVNIKKPDYSTGYSSGNDARQEEGYISIPAISVFVYCTSQHSSCYVTNKLRQFVNDWTGLSRLQCNFETPQE